MKYEIDNFTAILPVTCNANCAFCPEKEMPCKEDKSVWIDNLVEHIKLTRGAGYNHVSLTGGEPTLDLRLLGNTLHAIHSQTHIADVGITTNGKFLEAESSILAFLSASYHGKLLSFINISRHAFDTAENNRIMQVDYKHTLLDVIDFRRLLPAALSFRLNMVITADTDINKLFFEAKALYGVLSSALIQIAFRTDYALITDKGNGLIPDHLLSAFRGVFGEVETAGSCPTCISYKSAKYPGVMLKGANFEPTEVEATSRELIQHQDGALYHDWQRQKPVVLSTRSLPIYKQRRSIATLPCGSMQRQSGCSTGCGGRGC